MKVQGAPVLAIDLPAPRPKSLEKKIAEFDKYAIEFARAQSEKRELREALARAKDLDAQQFAQDLAADFSAEPTTTHQDKVKAETAAIEAKLPILASFADKAGDDLVRSVGDALDSGWRSELIASEEAEAAALRVKVAELEAALSAYGQAKAASVWAQAYTVNDALNVGSRRHKDVSYRPGQAVIPIASSVINSLGSTRGVLAVPAPVLIRGLEAVTEPEPGPKVFVDAPATVVAPRS